MSDEIAKQKITLIDDYEVEQLTVDCEDPAFISNADCLTFSYENGETFKATESGGSLTFIIPAIIILVIVLAWFAHYLI